MEFTVINNQKPFVVMEWEMFRELLHYLPKIALMEKFAPDTTTETGWGSLSKDEILDQIFIEYETQ